MLLRTSADAEARPATFASTYRFVVVQPFQMAIVQLAPLYAVECEADAQGLFSFASPKLKLVRVGVSSAGQAVVCC